MGHVLDAGVFVPNILTLGSQPRVQAKPELEEEDDEEEEEEKAPAPKVSRSRIQSPGVAALGQNVTMEQPKSKQKKID